MIAPILSKKGTYESGAFPREKSSQFTHYIPSRTERACSSLSTLFSILYIVFLLFYTLSILYICILLFLLSVSCPVTVILLHCGASVTITNSLYV